MPPCYIYYDICIKKVGGGGEEGESMSEWGRWEIRRVRGRVEEEESGSDRGGRECE